MCVTGAPTCVFFFQAEDGIRDIGVTGVQTCALPICINLCTSLTPAHIADLPTDPGTTGVVAPSGHTPCQAGTTSYNTGYTIAATSGRFKIGRASCRERV